MTIFPDNGPSPMRTMSCKTHSRFTSDSLTRGGFTFVDGTDAKPQAANSLISGGNSSLVAFIFSRIESETTLTTNSPVDSMLRSVSFFFPSRVFVGQKRIVGGLGHTPLK